MFGPTVSPYEHADHLFWLLSSASGWLPRRVHTVLLDGMASWSVWVWTNRIDTPGPTTDVTALQRELWNAMDGKKLRWTPDVDQDVRLRMQLSIRLLKLPESVEELLQAFLAHDLPGRYVLAQRELERIRRGSSANIRRKSNWKRTRTGKDK